MRQTETIPPHRIAACRWREQHKRMGGVTMVEFHHPLGEIVRWHFPAVRILTEKERHRIRIYVHVWWWQREADLVSLVGFQCQVEWRATHGEANTYYRHIGSNYLDKRFTNMDSARRKVNILIRALRLLFISKCIEIMNEDITSLQYALCSNCMRYKNDGILGNLL